MPDYQGVFGLITEITDLWTQNPQKAGCLKMMTVQQLDGSIVNFIVSPNTYFVDNVMLRVGDWVVGFYDASLPVILIYPPQYQAVVMARASYNQNLKVDFFNEQLISSDGQLKLNISPFTQIILENGQAFTNSIANRYLIVVYGAVTRSIPAQTVPYQIIVMCR